MSFLNRWTRDRRGATGIEYTLIAALISVVIVGALAILQGKLEGLFNTVSNAMPN